MRIHIAHDTVYRYAAPARYVIQKLRLTPRGHDGQHVRRWRIEVDHDCRLAERADAFGNIVHNLTLTGAIAGLTIAVEGEVETEDMAGVVTGTAERLPPALYLRETPLTEPDAAIHAFAAEFAAGAERLTVLHDMLGALNRRMTFDAGRTDAGTTAADAFHLGHGVCQDFAHVFIAGARALGIPARYVGGYLVQADGGLQNEAGHAWAEAHVPGLGWVAFDPANGVCANDAYVRVAAGLDYLGAAPVRGQQTGGAAETMDVVVAVRDVAQQQ